MSKYALKNMIKSIKNKPLSFVLTEVYLCICILALFLCYGVAGNYERLKQNREASESEKTIVLVFEPNAATVTIADAEKFLSSLSDLTQYEIKDMASYIDMDDISLDLGYRYDGTRFCFPAKKAESYSKNGWLISGRYFTEEEFDRGDKVVVIPDISIYDNLYEYDSETKTVILGDEIYKVVGTLDGEWIDLPITAVNPECKMRDMLLGLKHVITKDVYMDVVNKAYAAFGSSVSVQEVSFDESMEIRFYRKMFVQEVFVIIVAGVNILIIFLHLIITQKDKINIYYICGLGNIKIYIVFLLQWLYMIIPIYIAALFIYDRCVKNLLSAIYPYMASCMNMRAYVLITEIFFSVLGILGLCTVGRQLYRRVTREKVNM